jgi:nitrogenase molybdenum-iron protein alpha chain
MDQESIADALDQLYELYFKNTGMKNPVYELNRSCGMVTFYTPHVYEKTGDIDKDLLHRFFCAVVESYGDVKHFTVSKTQPYQLNALFKRVRTDFVIIRHQGLAPEAAKLGIPSLAMGDEHYPVGYDGIIRTGETILDILSRKKFNQVLSRHKRSPYNEWWLAQDDPFLLAHNPEILNERVNLNKKKGGRK